MSKKLLTLPLVMTALLLFTSCMVLEPNMRYRTLNDTMQAWVGRSERRLVAHFGIPQKSYETTDGSRFLTWITKTRDRTSYEKAAYCTQTFLVDAKGTVSAWKFSGLCEEVNYDTHLAVPSSRPIPRPSL